MDKILMRRYDVGDIVPATFREWENSEIEIECDNNVYFYCPEDDIMQFHDDAYALCDNNGKTLLQFYIIMFPQLDLSAYDEGTQFYIMDCMAQGEFSNSVQDIVEKYGHLKQIRLNYTIEYEHDIDYWTGIDEGYFYINTDLTDEE